MSALPIPASPQLLRLPEGMARCNPAGRCDQAERCARAQCAAPDEATEVDASICFGTGFCPMFLDARWFAPAQQDRRPA